MHAVCWCKVSRICVHLRHTVNDHSAHVEKEKEKKDSAMFVQQYKYGRGKKKHKNGKKNLFLRISLHTCIKTPFFAKIS